MRKILVVTSSLSVAFKLSDLLPNDELRGCFRDYHFQGDVNDWKPDLIVSDGTCTTRGGYGPSAGIAFDPRPFAQTKNIPASSLFWFMIKARVGNFFSAKVRMSTR